MVEIDEISDLVDKLQKSYPTLSDEKAIEFAIQIASTNEKSTTLKNCFNAWPGETAFLHAIAESLENLVRKK